MVQYVRTWWLITAWLAYEYLCLNHIVKSKSLLSLIALGKGKQHLLSPKPGDSLSFVLGWIGFLVICLTNIYVVKKRWGTFDDRHQSARWLDFHIFCGLMGPTLILFHCNFKVQGLVAISFWSMMVSAFSGVVGRYFYLQLLSQKGDLGKSIVTFEKGFKQYAKSNKRGFTLDHMEHLKGKALKMAKANVFVNNQALTPFDAILTAISGDLHIKFSKLGAREQLPGPLRSGLKQYAIYQRQMLSLDYFRKMMGYWHTFHAPFAIFMYVVALIHIVSSLIFLV